jgi:ornithine cyclodeaminase
VRAADLVVTATPSTAPIVSAAWLRPGMHLTAVGADGPGKQELEAACLARAEVVVADRLAQCVRLGELQHAVKAGLRRPEDVVELGAVVAGRCQGRTTAGQITIADLTGVGIQDTAIASAAFRLASP